MPYHVLLSLPPHTKVQGPGPESRRFRVSMFFVIKHVQFRKSLMSFPISWHLQIVMITLSLSCYLAFFLSFVNPVPQYHCNWHIHNVLLTLKHPHPIEPDRFADPDCQSLRWSSASQRHPCLINQLLAKSRESSYSLEKMKLWVSWIHMLLRPVGDLTSQQVTNSMSNISNITPHESQNNYNSNHLWQDTKSTRIDLETFEISIDSQGVWIYLWSDFWKDPLRILTSIIKQPYPYYANRSILGSWIHNSQQLPCL